MARDVLCGEHTKPGSGCPQAGEGGRAECGALQGFIAIQRSVVESPCRLLHASVTHMNPAGWIIHVSRMATVHMTTMEWIY